MLSTDYKTYPELEAKIINLAESNKLNLNFNKNTSALKTIKTIIQNIMYYQQADKITFENNLSRDTCDAITDIRVFGPLSGVEKQGATHTRQPMQIQTSKAESIDENFIGCDSKGAQYKPSQTYNFTSAGTFTKDSNNNDVIFVAVETGEVMSDINDITNIITQKDGILAIRNIQPYISLGANEESDESYKNKINESPRGANVEGSTEILERDLLNIGCTKASVRPNPTAEKVFDIEKGAMCICIEYAETIEQISKITQTIANNDMVKTKQKLIYDGVDYSITSLYNCNDCVLPVIWNKPKYTEFFTKIIVYGSQENINKLDITELKTYLIENIKDSIKFMTYKYNLNTKLYEINDGIITSNDISQIVLNYFTNKGLSGLTCGNIRFSKTSSTEIIDFQVSPEHINELLKMTSDKIVIEAEII
jgi:hypothetical protein